MSIKRTKKTHDTERLFLDELIARIDGVKRRVVQTISQSAADNIQNKAPRNDNELGNYTENIKVSQINRDPNFVVSVEEYSKANNIKNPQTALLYIKDIDKPTSKDEKIYKALRRYEPLTVKTWPSVIPRDSKYVFMRTASDRDVKTISEKNIREFPEMQKTLSEFNIRLRKSQMGFSDTSDIPQDFVFTVLRKEKGLAGPPKPHWRPGINESKLSSTLSKIKKDPEIENALGNPSYHNYGDLGIIQEKTTEDVARKTERFRKMIIGD